MKEHDVCIVLEREQRWHKEQIARIDRALATIQKRRSASGSLQEPTRWANEVDRVFQSHQELTPQEVIRNLIDNGVWEATLATRRDTIYATLTRKVRQGKLIRTEHGTYKKA